MTPELDQTNRKILAELVANARIPISELARKVGLSKTPVAQRIKQLEEMGLITGYRAILSPTPMLGVCLGHQALAELYGATVSHAPELMHGRTSIITHEPGGVFDGVENPQQITRYHSLAVEPETMPDELRVTAQTDSGIIMAIEHVDKPLWGVQFHPESVMTKGGHRMLANWLALCGDADAVVQAEGKAPLVRS